MNFAPEDCNFCDSNILLKQFFYENDRTLALVTDRPLARYHSLIIPKRHVARFEELTGEEIESIGILIQKIHSAVARYQGETNYYLIQKNGLNAGQSVMHVHVHYIPIPKNQKYPIMNLLRRLIYRFFPALKENQLKANAQKMKQMLAENT